MPTYLERYRAGEREQVWALWIKPTCASFASHTPPLAGQPEPLDDAEPITEREARALRRVGKG